MSLTAALTSNRAGTNPVARDHALRGRTYAIPFAHVWDAALALARGGLRGWSVTAADDRAGTIDAEVAVPVFGWVDDVRIDISLDVDAQTRVDLVSAARGSRADLGRNRRRIRRFCRTLDRALAAPAHKILNPPRGAR